MYRFTIGNDSVYVVRNVRDASTGAAIPTSATGTLTVRELPGDGEEPGTGAVVGGQSWPALFAWSAEHNGFAGTIFGSIDVSNRRIYEIIATLDGGPELQWQEIQEMRVYGGAVRAAGAGAALGVPAPDLPSVSLSTVAVSDDTITEGDTITLTLTARLASGTLMTVGGLAVVFTQSGGTSAGTISATTDVGDGTYTATFFALTAGTATTIGATMDGVPVTSALPTVTVSAQDAYDTSGAIDEDVCFFSEDWTDYADTDEMLVQMGTGNDVGKIYWQCEHNELATIDPTKLLAGHHTAKHTLPGGGVNTTWQPKVFTRNALNGGDGTNAPFYSKLWARYRFAFGAGFNLEGTPGSQGGAAYAFKVWSYGWLGGAPGHTSGRHTHEFTGGAQSPNRLKIGLEANPGASNFTDIALQDDQQNLIGTLWSDEQFYDVVELLEYTGDGLTYRLRTWWAPTGQVPTKITDLTGPVDITPGHEGDPGIELTVPRADRMEPGSTFNRTRTDPLHMWWGSFEWSNGVQHANPFKLPAAELL